MKAAAPIACLVLLLAPAGHASEPIVSERIVAVVNSEIILLGEVKERAQMLGLRIEEGTTPEAQRKTEQQLQQVVDRMVDDLLVMQQATDLKLTVEPGEIDRAIDEVKKMNNLDDGQFQEALASQGFTLASYRKDLRKQLLRLKVVNTAVRAHINVSDEEVKAFYEQNARTAGARRSAHVRHILVAVADDADGATVEQRKRVAQRVIDEAVAGQEFGALAKTYSDDAGTRDKDGDLGWLNEDDALPEALLQAIFSGSGAGPDKNLRGPLRTGRGFEVVQVLERKDGGLRPLEEVKDQIRQQLMSTQMEKQTQSWLNELRKKAHVDVRL